MEISLDEGLALYSAPLPEPKMLETDVTVAEDRASISPPLLALLPSTILLIRLKYESLSFDKSKPPPRFAELFVTVLWHSSTVDRTPTRIPPADPSVTLPDTVLLIRFTVVERL